MPFGSRVGCGYFNLIAPGNGDLFQRVNQFTIVEKKSEPWRDETRIVDRRCRCAIKNNAKCVVLAKRENVKHISLIINNQQSTTNNLQVSKPLTDDILLSY
jgi:hypothetical protein